MSKEIKIYNYTNSPIAETMELGDQVFSSIKPQIEECINSNTKVIIDFSDITSLTTKFLNNAIGKLFLTLDLQKLINNMNFIGLDPAKKTTLRWSLNVAINKSKSLSKSNN
ncbi:STAS-like domain-containing protein [Clostridium saudiense]|uniref:STAS-like domain-containing protein n=1 Tax=Clostridium saudiense TaxID=1414720 RepID=UPI0018A94C94|nr:STAS-like domain-containing protein [Clostridium saudiense]